MWQQCGVARTEVLLPQVYITLDKLRRWWRGSHNPQQAAPQPIYPGSSFCSLLASTVLV